MAFAQCSRSGVRRPCRRSESGAMGTALQMCSLEPPRPPRFLRNSRRSKFSTLRGESRPRLVRARSIDRRHFSAGDARVDRELPAVMDLIRKQKPEDVDPRNLAHRLRAAEEVHLFQQIFIRRIAHELDKFLMLLLDRREHLVPALRSLWRSSAQTFRQFVVVNTDAHAALG